MISIFYSLLQLNLCLLLVPSPALLRENRILHQVAFSLTVQKFAVFTLTYSYYSKPRTIVGDNSYKREGQSDNTSQTSIILVGLQKAFDVTLNINNRVYAG